MTKVTPTIEAIICGVICDHGLDVGDIVSISAVMQSITDGDALVELGMDDVDVIEVIHRVEQTFTIQIPDDCVTIESSVSDIVSIVSDLLVEKAQREARAESISKAWRDYPADDGAKQ